MITAQVWLELYRTPSEEDRELISEVFQSWYMLGRLGGFNGMNMQVESKQRLQSTWVPCLDTTAHGNASSHRCSTKAVTTQAIWLMMRRNASQA